MDRMISYFIALAVAAGLMFAWDRHPHWQINMPDPLPGSISFPDSLGAKYASDEAKLATAVANAARHAKVSAAISQTAQAALVRTVTQIEYRTQTLTKEVPTYVTAQDDARCVVPLGFVRLHDAAAAGQPSVVPAPAGGSDEAASGIPLSEVLATDIANLGVGYDYRAEVMTWRQWYADQAKAWSAKP